MMKDRSAARGRTTVVLNGNGARIKGGYEDATANRSSIVWSDGRESVRVPAYSGDRGRWGSIVRCVQQHFDAYDVTITDERPRQGSYIMMMVGGRASMLGYSDSVAGVAPYTGGIVDDAIGFVFSASIGNDPRGVCETTAHEIGHTLGLDHTDECTDLMSYRHGCGDKSFRDLNMRCGEWNSRRCASGHARQNSHQILASHVGLRRSRPEPSSPKKPTAPKEPRPQPRRPTPHGDTQAPRISVHAAGGRTFEADSVFVVRFDVKDRSGLDSIELLWTNNGRTEVFRCGDLPADQPIACGMIDGSYGFALAVGEGTRRYAVRVTDEFGNTATTRWRHAQFVDRDGVDQGAGPGCV